MKKKAKNVPPVTEETPEKSTSEPIPEAVEVQEQKPLSTREEIEQLKMQMDFANKNFEQIQIFMQRMSPLIALSEKIEAQKQQQVENPQQQAPAGLGNMGGIQAILPFMQMLTGGGGGGSDEFKQLAMESMKADISFTKALKSAVISKITAPAAQEIADATK